MDDSGNATQKKNEGLSSTTTTEIPWAWVNKVRHIVDDARICASEGDAGPVEILPWLFISDQASLRNRQRLVVDAGITHVLSVNGMPRFMLNVLSDRFATWKIGHCHVRGEDQEGYDMIDHHWEDCLDFVQKARTENQNAKIVVHCSAGINRSGLIVAALYMTLTKTPVVEVVECLVALRRGMILWNRSFQVQLCMLAAREGLLGACPAGYANEPPSDDVLGPPPTAKSSLDRLTKV